MQPNPTPQPYAQPTPAAAVALTAKFFPLFWLCYFVKPVITVNGYRWMSGVWGRNVLPLVPGRHRLEVHTPYLLRKLGPAVRVVDVLPGQTLELEYRSSAMVGVIGSLGPAPQKYNGQWFLIALYIVLGVLVVARIVTSTLS